ncbi:MAG: acetylornithine deacetylase [Gemmatimonadetes bacterium]|nr:acetylornithine deacetylase [Gemmatimonadota bacterium]
MPLLSDADLLARLVGFDSVSRSSNLPLADFLCQYLDRPGVSIQRNPSPDSGKTNLVITIGPEGDERRKGLVLSGHMDVVPADEPDWHSDPFVLTESGESYVGRGASDMKGFLAIAANAAAQLDPKELIHPLVFLFTYDEEVGTIGAKHFADTWPDAGMMPKSTIIGEPTSLHAIRMHKGHMAIRLVVEGAPAHSGYPHLGRSAIEPVGRMIVALTDLRTKLASEHPPNREHFPEVPFVPLNIAQVSGGSAINVVPDLCELNIGFRLLPKMESGPLLERIRETIRDALGDTQYDLEVRYESPPMLLREDAHVYQTLCRHIGQEDTHSVSYATDAGWLQTMGFECVIWGPGSIEVAHKPNESMPIGQLERGARLVSEIIAKHCLSPE